MACPTTTLDILLLALQSRIMAETTFNGPNLCWLGLTPAINILQPGDRWCVITPDEQIINEQFVVDTNMTTLVFSGYFKITVWSRLALDNVTTANRWLTDANYGALPGLNQIVSAVHLFSPVDADGNNLTMQPFLVGGMKTFDQELNGVMYGAITTEIVTVYRYSV